MEKNNLRLRYGLAATTALVLGCSAVESIPSLLIEPTPLAYPTVTPIQLPTSTGSEHDIEPVATDSISTLQVEVEGYTETAMPTYTPSPTPSPTFTPDSGDQPFNFSDDEILTPQIRETAMIATHESILERGNEGLIEDGMPEVVLTSQRNIGVDFKANINIDGSGDITYESGVDAGVTVVNMEGSGFSDNILLIGAGHAVDTPRLTEKVRKNLMDPYKNVNIEVDNLTLTKLTIGENITLDFDQLGYAYVFSEEGDFVMISIPKNILTDDQIDELLKGSISIEDLSFEAPTSEKRYAGRCQTYFGDDTVQAITLDARYFADDGELSLIKPYLVGPGCSGSGVFEIDSAGKARLAGITVAYRPDYQGTNTSDIVFTLSKIGVDNFWTTLGEIASNR